MTNQGEAQNKKVIPMKKAVRIIAFSILTGAFILGGIMFFIMNAESTLSMRPKKVTEQHRGVEGRMIDIENERYKEELGEVLGDMEVQVAFLRVVCAGFVDVWENSIYSNSDTKLMIKMIGETLDDTYQSESIALKETRIEIRNAMKKLADPPQECRELHSLALQMYGHYSELYELANYPDGTYTTYADRVATAESRFKNIVDKILVTYPDITIGTFTDECREFLEEVMRIAY